MTHETRRGSKQCAVAVHQICFPLEAQKKNDNFISKKANILKLWRVKFRLYATCASTIQARSAV